MPKGAISLPPPQFYELMRLRLATGTPLSEMCNPQRITPQIVISEDDTNFLCNVLPGDYLYIKENAESVAPRILPKSEILAFLNKEVPQSIEPIHRMTYVSSSQLQYTKMELHIKNIEKMAGNVHLFCLNKLGHV
ncbi:putative nudix hydrolase 7 [Ditylenchus destructor]|uniref:Nudix hydrolase 7 n=1 Tax=Ditylenchus destructor TaxID=166010 RepID=A0AAD4RBK1_9BILA|nr:putative nudix hydrolase 7 [Ditylenchus destructor]